MKWICNSCEKPFEAPPGKNGFFDFGAPRCPECGSEDVDQMDTCDICGTNWKTERLESYGKLDVCPGCKALFHITCTEAINNIRSYSRGRVTAKEIRIALSDYMDE